jgi:hypothetical protein
MERRTVVVAVEIGEREVELREGVGAVDEDATAAAGAYTSWSTASSWGKEMGCP